MDSIDYAADAERYARRSADLYRQGGEAWVRGEHSLAETLFKQGLNALDRAARARSIADAHARAGAS